MASNGHLTSNELAPAAGGVGGSDPGCGHLEKDTARRWNAMAVKIKDATGVRIGCNGPDSMYRSYARQVYWRAYWCSRGACGNAASPGSSNHGWGKAIDNSYRGVIDAYGAPYGFRWACSDAPWEPWHLKDCGPSGAYSGPDPGPDYEAAPDKPRFPVLNKGDRGDAVRHLQEHLREWNLGIARPDKVDGSFGEQTADAVRQFQVVHHLKNDGVVGKATWQKLRKRIVLTDSELSHWNRVRLLEAGENVTDHEREQIRGHREWIGRRVAWMRSKPDKWWSHRRLARFHLLKLEDR